VTRKVVPWADAAVAVTLAIAAFVEMALHVFNGSGPGAVVVALVATLAVAWRRREPLAVAAVEAAAIVVPPLLGIRADSLVLAVAAGLAVYSAGAHAPLRRSWLALVAVAGAQALVIARAADGRPFDIVYTVTVFGAAWAVGVLVGRRTRQVGALRTLAAELHEEHGREAEAAVAAERARIARELHDVIAHSLSVMVVQAGVVEQLLRSDPERARRAAMSIQEVGEQTSAELRRLLGLIRTTEDGAPLAPQPGLAHLPRLVEQLRAAGQAVQLRTVGTPRELPPGVDLAAHRIVQEALTNARKHAPAAPAMVTVRYGVHDVTLSVSTDAPAGRGQSGAESGYGLIGMRERCALYGGRLTVAPTPVGFAIEAVLPVPGAPEEPR
jgi:signal transduction histidine kinase